MCFAGGERKRWDVEEAIMCRVHDGAIGVADGDWVAGDRLVCQRRTSGKEVSGAAGVGDGGAGGFWVDWDDGRT